MATTLESYDFKVTRGKYPWEEWLDGSIWRLSKGEDFQCEPATFRSSAISKAKRLGINLKSSVAGDQVVIQAVANGKAK